MNQMIKTVTKTLSDNSPAILTGLAAGGVVGTAILAVKATPKALSLLEDDWQDRLREGQTQEPLHTKKDIVRIAWKCYIPAAIMGATTIGCLIAAHNIGAKRTAALASLYSISETALKEYQAKVVEQIGEGKEKKVRDAIDKDHIEKTPLVDKEVIFTGNGEVLCYEHLSGRYFKSEIEKIRQTVNNMNRRMVTEMNMTLNEVYSELGLPPVALGNEIGWDVDSGFLDADFSSQLHPDTNQPCLVLTLTPMPESFR